MTSRSMTCMGWLCSPRKTTGRSRKECEEDSFYKKPNVNEEYLEAFRTKSYMEISNKAQVQLGKTASTKRLSSSSSSSSLPLSMKLTEYLLEPRQETIANMTQTLKVHHLLVDYFETSLEACYCCDKILEAIHSMLITYRRIKHVVKLSKIVLDCNNDHANNQTQMNKDVIYRELASFVSQNNPLSIISSTQFREIRDQYMKLLQRLKSKRGEIRRKLTLKRVCKIIGGIALVTSHCVVLIGLLVFAFHSIVGLVAAPSIVGCMVGLFIKMGGERVRQCSYERLLEQVDVAARGVYIMVNDLDTMSRMVKRLHDEVEHRKVVADVCVRNGKCEMLLKQVVREFHEHESGFLEQLEELEEHIYLCFLTTNRSRGLLLQEITEKKH